MRLKTFSAGTTSEALGLVHEELGDSALILETRRESGQTEIVAAEVPREEPVEALSRLRAEVALLRHELARYEETVRGLSRAAGAARPAAPAADEAESHPAPTVDPELLVGLYGHGEDVMPTPTVKPIDEPAPTLVPATPARHDEPAIDPEVAPRLIEIYRRLTGEGVEPTLVRRILQMAARAPRGEGDPLSCRESDTAVQAVAGLLPGIGPTGNRPGRCFAFVGPAGAGKTHTVAKLMHLTRAGGGQSLGVIALESGRPGASDVLHRAALQASCSFRSVRGAEELTRAVADLDQVDRILIDTSGVKARDRGAIRALREMLRVPGQLAVQLVLPASADAADATPFRELEPSAVVITKVDLADRLGALINLPAALNLPPVAIAHGPSEDRELTAATRRVVAEVVLGRRQLGDAVRSASR